MGRLMLVIFALSTVACATKPLPAPTGLQVYYLTNAAEVDVYLKKKLGEKTLEKWDSKPLDEIQDVRIVK